MAYEFHSDLFIGTHSTVCHQWNKTAGQIYACDHEESTMTYVRDYTIIYQRRDDRVPLAKFNGRSDRCIAWALETFPTNDYIHMYRNEIVLKAHPVTKFKNLSLLGSIRTKLELGAIKWQQYMHITATVSHWSTLLYYYSCDSSMSSSCPPLLQQLHARTSIFAPICSRLIDSYSVCQCVQEYGRLSVVSGKELIVQLICVKYRIVHCNQSVPRIN